MNYHRQFARRLMVGVLMLALVACTGGLPFSELPFPSAAPSPPSATDTASVEYPPATATALEFVDALNRQDYLLAFELLDETGRRTLLEADNLRQEYANARSTAIASSVSYSLRGGLLQQGSQAVASLVGVWETAFLGTFSVTSTLTLKAEGEDNAWHVAWTRDLIVPGLTNGTLVLQRELPQRGVIFAADGSTLAGQEEMMVLGVRRSEIPDTAEEQAMLWSLSQLTGLPTDTIKSKYQDLPADWFVPVATVSEETLALRSDLISPWRAISARSSFRHIYPQPDVAPHVVGYVGAIPPETADAFRARGYNGDEQVGLSGVEGQMDQVLAGAPGVSLHVVRLDGAEIPVARKDFTPARDVTLTISPSLQLSVQTLLGQRNGAVVVMNPRDGAIFAMASYPSFSSTLLIAPDLSDQRVQLIRDPARPLLNRAVQGIYPPGSTFKMVSMAAGLHEGITRPDDVFNDPGHWDGLGKDYRKTCWLKTGHGRITLQDGLSASCDTVFYEVGKRLDQKGQGVLSQYARDFGYGATTGVELVGESAGVVPDGDWKKANLGGVWTSGDTVNLSIGQGFLLATPLQVAQMTAAIANGSTLLQPRVVAAIGGRGDIPAQTMGAQPVRPLPLSAQALEAIQRGMAGVTTNTRVGTTTYRFSTFDYYITDGRIVAGRTLTAQQREAATKLVVAGKSGTAQAPGATEKPFAWFTAYAPAHDPQVVVTVLLENMGEGSVYAAPLVRQILESYFGLPISTPSRDIRATD